ncbi:MAG: indolepyruvate ferredoxin oxidoreductase subunit alpha [Candidatus Bipolaricaulia bacterium]
MAFIIADPCIGTKSSECVQVCPVDCIHPRPDEDGFEEADQLFIDPETCINCAACAAVCPVEAIYPEEDLPEQWRHYIEINAQHYESS